MILHSPKGRPDWRVPARLMLLGSVLAWPSLSQAATCTISPQNATISPGETAGWTYTTDLGRNPSSSWTFEGGSPSSARRTAAPTVSYPNAGTFTTTLVATGSRGSATCTATVQVSGALPEPEGLPEPVGQEDNTALLGRDQGTHVVLGANDLGMHCADQDDSIFSVLPPFNVLHAQVIRRGGTPAILDGSQVQVTYSAASNPSDPVGPDSINSTSANWPVGATTGLQVYKGNFWDINPDTGNPQGFDTYEPLFFGLLSPAAVLQDLGLPAPETTLLTDCLPGPLGNGAPDGSDCAFEQQAMPGISDPYYANEPEAMHFDRDTGFFADLLGSANSIPGVVGQPLGGVINNVNWFRADGIPILPVDDSGRDNAYPLVRVMAKQGGLPVASTDVVLPVAAEADCQLCHADPIDCADPDLPPEIQTDQCNGIAVSPTAVSSTTFDVEMIETAPGETAEQKLLNAAKINILRLHDAKHGSTLDATRNVVCASCHYSPALDLAQVGPQADQVGNISMSRAMHGHHGDLKVDGQLVFPNMPPPDQRLPGDQQDVLMQTCYQCHPGKRTQCLRGAMGGAGIVCQDCHGNMTQVGNDFTGGGPRVSWASEPKCQSCHTGDAVNKNHPANAIVAPDGIRLLQAYTTTEHSNAGGDALPILSPSSRFAENETLYRLSGNDDGSGKGHGGVMCEGCHGSTHAIWPNANPNANDNVAANQLQGHAGTISECSTCHITSELSASTQAGPHGMHLVNDRRFWKEAHKDAAKQQNGRPGGGTCGACHGSDHLGTELSRTPVTRTWNVESKDRTVLAGDPVGCGVCHSVSKSFGR